MTTLIAAPPDPVGHPALAPDITTDTGRLRSVALGRSVLADLLGGWLVQQAATVMTGTAAGSGLLDVAVVDDPSPADLANVAALRPDGADLGVWSLRPIPPTPGWEERPAASMAVLPARTRANARPDVPHEVEVARVADPAAVRELRTILDGLGLHEPIGDGILADPRIRAWTAGHGAAGGCLLAVVVDHLDVVAAIAGTTTPVAALLDGWRRDRPDLDGVAVLAAGHLPWRDRSRIRTSTVHVAGRSRATPT